MKKSDIFATPTTPSKKRTKAPTNKKSNNDSKLDTIDLFISTPLKEKGSKVTPGKHTASTDLSSNRSSDDNDDSQNRVAPPQCMITDEVSLLARPINTPAKRKPFKKKSISPRPATIEMSVHTGSPTKSQEEWQNQANAESVAEAEKEKKAEDLLEDQPKPKRTRKKAPTKAELKVFHGAM